MLILTRDKIAHLKKIKPTMLERGPVCLRLPWIEAECKNLFTQISSVCECYFSVEIHVVLDTRPILLSIR